MDHDELALSLSDVVHDHTIDSTGHDHDDSQSQDMNEEPSSAFHSSNAILAPLSHDYSVGGHNMSSSESFSVEMLEREIASLLNQNASAASAALLSAAAQQRQANMDFVGSDGTDPDAESATNNIAGLGLNLSGLAAVLQAAHAQAAENERAAEQMAAKGPDYARQQSATLIGKEQTTTRTVPAFHSLTADKYSDASRDNRRRTEGRSTSEGSDYLFSDADKGSDGDDMADATGARRDGSPIHQVDGPTVSSNTGLPPVGGDFSDISDILGHFSAQFEETTHAHELSPPDSPPIISHSRDGELSSPISSTTFHNNASQPIASTSSLPDSNGKKGKKGKEKKAAPFHVCGQVHCQKSFSRRSDLARHMRIHTGERPFVCSHAGCGKTFIQRSALHVHSRVHTGEKPHCCEYPACGKTFGDSSSLARHRRTHTGKRPYKCEDPTCEKTFTRRTTLTSHMRTHDPNWEPDPNVKYNFKGKKRKISEDEDNDELVDSVRTISALFQAGGDSLLPNANPDEPLEARVASISAEIAAAIAQAQSRAYDDDDDDDDEDEDEDAGDDSGSGQEMGGTETIGPNTSGIRGLSGDKSYTDRATADEDEEDDSDEFPEPLRPRKAREGIVTGTKRKR